MTETVAVQAEAETLSDPKTVNFGKDLIVPIGEVTAFAKPKCASCISSPGIITQVFIDPKTRQSVRSRTICACAATRYLAHRKASKPSVVEAPDESANGKSDASAKTKGSPRYDTKVARLQEELSKLEGALAVREHDHTTGLLLVQVDSDEKGRLVQKIEADIVDAKAQTAAHQTAIETLVEDIESCRAQISQIQQYIKAIAVASDDMSFRKKAIEKELEPIGQKIVLSKIRFVKDTAGLRAHIRRLQSQLGIAIAYRDSHKGSR